MSPGKTGVVGQYWATDHSLGITSLTRGESMYFWENAVYCWAIGAMSEKGVFRFQALAFFLVRTHRVEFYNFTIWISVRTGVITINGRNTDSL